MLMGLRICVPRMAGITTNRRQRRDRIDHAEHGQHEVRRLAGTKHQETERDGDDEGRHHRHDRQHDVLRRAGSRCRRGCAGSSPSRGSSVRLVRFGGRLMRLSEDQRVRRPAPCPRTLSLSTGDLRLSAPRRPGLVARRALSLSARRVQSLPARRARACRLAVPELSRGVEPLGSSTALRARRSGPELRSSFPELVEGAVEPLGWSAGSGGAGLP